MKSYYTYILLLIAVCFFACQNDREDEMGQTGILQLRVETNGGVVPKAAYDPEQIAVSIVNEKNEVVKSTDDWETLKDERITLPVGTYQIKASSAGFDGKEVAFSKPYYAGSKTVTIRKDEQITTQIECTLANVKVSATYSERFKSNFTSWSVNVSNTDGSLLFGQNESRSGYFTAKDLTWKLSVVNKKGALLNMEKKITAPAPRDHYIFKFDIQEETKPDTGSGDITIKVDESLQEYTYTVKIPTNQTGEPEAPAVITTGEANAWTTFARLSGTAVGIASDATVQFKYRNKNEGGDWLTATPVLNNTTYVAELTTLPVATTFEYYISDGTIDGTVREFTTESILSIPNAGFEGWQQPAKPWLVYASGDEMFWDSGNHGAVTLGASYNITVPDESDKHGGDRSIKMSSKNIIIKFAAGNVFSGKYLDTDGTDGVLGFGRPFASRPSRLKGFFKYNQGTINRAPSSAYPNTPAEAKKNNPDKGIIYIAMGDWTPETFNGEQVPVLIRTSSKNQQLFNKNGANVIAYGEKVIDTTVSNWEEFAVDLVYRSDRKPKYIIIVASASIFGDYFVGSDSSVLSLDDLSLDYPTAPPAIQ